MRHCPGPIGLCVQVEPAFDVGIIYTTLPAVSALGNPLYPVLEHYLPEHEQNPRNNLQLALPSNRSLSSFSPSSILGRRPQLQRLFVLFG
jgi:hypothetical protein